MPYDSNGVFSRVMNWTSDQQNGIAIECGRHDQEDDNFAQGFNQVFCRDGRAAATGNFNMGSHKIQNLANGTANTDAVNKRQMETAISSAQSTITTNYQNYVKTVLGQIYPVGSVYIGTQATCPMASLITGSTWTLVSSGKALWTGNGSNGNSTIAAGLPNITGTFGSGCMMNWQESYVSGAMYRATVEQNPQNAGGTEGGTKAGIGFDASRSNNIYGRSSTVQPPAYVVNVWRRTA